jgi:NTP pyrophosphatase (non-canonical NTP hydrolase)
VTQDGLYEVRDKLREFAHARDWDQFHSPRNLATALAVETAELLEHFQWLRDDQGDSLSPDTHEAVGLEMADVLLYLIRLADKLEIDLLAVANQKLRINEQKYPIELSKGNARKYRDL